MSLRRVILVLRECIWNAPAVSLVFPAFDDIGSLGSPPRRVVYFCDCLSFPYGEPAAIWYHMDSTPRDNPQQINQSLRGIRRLS